MISLCIYNSYQTRYSVMYLQGEYYPHDILDNLPKHFYEQ
jgi:hypothetical protein